MKKYKLVKWYPSMGLTETGFIVKQKEENGDYYPTKKCSRFVFKASEIENNPEFWEKVVEKDYEILQMKNVHGNSYSLFKNEELSRYERENHTIHSVKRLSDSEVFTIGDLIMMQWRSKKGIIESIYYNEHNQLSFKIEGSEAPLTSVFTKKYPIKLKQPLFTTEDGVDIFEGDNYWWVDLDFGIFELSSKTEAIKNLKLPYTSPSFSTKKAAEEYILMNKPCSLSYTEVIEQIPFTDKDREIQKNLRDLVKSKL